MSVVSTLTSVFAAMSVAACMAVADEADPLAPLTTAVEAKDFGRALELAEALGQENGPPEEVEKAVVRAAVACVKEMELEAAAGFYRLLLENYPQSEHARDARAELLGCYYTLRQLESAIAQAKVNLAADPDSEWVEYWHFVIAQSEFRLWRFDQSKPKLEKFLENYPDGSYAKYAKSCLEKIDPAWEIDGNGLVRYTGKYQSDVRLQEALETLPQDIETGYRTLEERLGIDLRPHTKVIFFLEDAGKSAKPGLKASTYVVGLKNQPAVVMRFYTEYIVTQPEGYRQTITHEMKHAGFKGIMGQAYEDLPSWVKEGLAVWGADDVNTRLQLVLSNKFVGGKDPMVVLDGITDFDRDEADYLEDALAFEWLESKGAGNVRSFCRGLAAGKPYRELWAELSGMDYQEAIAQADAYCRKRVSDTLGDSYDEIVRLRDANKAALNAGEAATRRWLAIGGEAALEKWIAEHPEHAAEPFVRFCLARSFARTGRGEEGREILQRILDEDCLRCTLLDDAQFWIGVSYNWAGDQAKAAEAFGVLLRDFPASHSAKQVRGKFRPSGPLTESGGRG